MEVDLSKYQNALGFKNQIVRCLWTLIWFFCARWLPRSLGNGWKLFLLRMFGAKVHKSAMVYSSVRVYMPWNLEMLEYSCLASEVDCYNVAPVKIGAHAIVSQKSYICAASHDVSKSNFPLVTAPIVIEDKAWVGAAVFIGPGVKVGEGAVVGATASVYKNVEPWTIVGGNPAKVIKKRVIHE